LCLARDGWRRWRSASCRQARRIALACAAALALADAASATRVLVLKAADTPRLGQTLAAMRERTSLEIDVIRLAAARDDALRSAIANGERDGVLVALGPKASDFVMKLASPGPVVHCLAGADALRAGVPAVPSEAPVDIQTRWLGKLVPRARNVGVLFDPAINARRAEALAAALDMAGYKALLQPVAGTAALPAALAALAGRADVLLALPDRTVYAPESATGILLFSFRNGIPLIGPNEAWVKRGALYAVDWDYREVGAACASLAARMADGASSPPPAPPRPHVWANRNSAARFGLAWDPDMLRREGVRHE
jgi:putative ABC transport system substrate-binding protein